MYYFRARKQLNLSIYPDFDHIHYTGNTCYVGYDRELTYREIEERDLVILGFMKHEVFLATYGAVQSQPLFQKGLANAEEGDMKNYTKQYLKGLLREYPLLQMKIDCRKEEIRHPDQRETDENLGGSSGGRVGNPTEAVVMKMADDERIQLYESYQNAIETTLQQCTKETQDIVACRYFEQMNQEEVSEKLGLTVAVVRVGENYFLKKLAKRLKLMQ